LALSTVTGTVIEILRLSVTVAVAGTGDAAPWAKRNPPLLVNMPFARPFTIRV